jgi:hypothetical protein
MTGAEARAITAFAEDYVHAFKPTTTNVTA